MNEKISQQASAYLESDSKELQQLLNKAKALKALNDEVSALLDPTLASYCQVANLVGDHLVLLVANGSIATQIRFQALDLVRKFKQHPSLQRIRHIECKVRPTQGVTPPSSRMTANSKRRKVDLLTSETAEVVKSIADSIEDPKLREIMKRIAEHRVKRGV